MTVGDQTTRFEAVRSAEAGARLEGQTVSPEARLALDAWAASGDDEGLRQAIEKTISEAKLKGASQRARTLSFGD